MAEIRGTQQVLDFLNREGRHATDQHWLPRARVRGLLYYLGTAEQLLEKYEEEKKAGLLDHEYFDSCPPDLQNAVTGANNILQDYPRFPALEIFYKPDGDADLEISLGCSSRGRSNGEIVAVFTIEKIFQAKQIRQVDQCACGKYFFRRRQDQQFCSAKCRHRNYEQTAGGRTRRQRYMREYYQLKKSGKVK